MFHSLATLQFSNVLQLPGVAGRDMVTEWVKEVAVGAGLCACMLWISTMHKHNGPTANCVSGVSSCVHTVCRHVCVFTMGNPRRKCGSPSLPARSQHWDHQGHETTDNYWLYPCRSPVCCWLHRLAYLAYGKFRIDPLTALKQNMFFVNESNYYLFSLKKASSKIYAQMVRSCLAVQLSPPHGQLFWKGTDLPFCSQHLHLLRYWSSSKSSGVSSEELNQQKMRVCRVSLFLGPIHCKLPNKRQGKVLRERKREGDRAWESLDQ